jgi:hypothetical protein
LKNQFHSGCHANLFAELVSTPSIDAIVNDSRSIVRRSKLMALLCQEVTGHPDCEIVLADNSRRLLCYQFVLARHSPVLRTNIGSPLAKRDTVSNNVIIRAVDRLTISRPTANAGDDLR